jgi:5'-nucleotidase (lipoprotein e(P4) family)
MRIQLNRRFLRAAGAAAGIFCVLLWGCAPASPRQEGESHYNRDTLIAILWQQASGEYAALCYQAFNAGKSYLLSLPAGGKKAIVFDIDETLLDNSPYAAWLAVTGKPWSNDTWQAWCGAADAEALPGAREFALFAAERGFEIFYVSNRPHSVSAGTVANLAKLGFPRADTDHVFLMRGTSDKTPRLEDIQSRGYEIVLAAGDNLDDFLGDLRKRDNEKRKAWVKENAGSFGAYRIVLPNAVYGTFESALRPDYNKSGAREKAAVRLEKLRAWNP